VKVSIICAAYNNVDTIKQTIESFLSQDYKDKELLIADGASTDGTLEIIQSFGDQIVYKSGKDGGLYEALNTALSMATGEVIGTIGADDFYPTNDILSTVAKTFIDNNIDSTYGDKVYVDQEDTSKVARYWQPGEYDRNRFLNGWMPPHLTFYLKRKHFEKYGNYKTNYKIAADYELLIRMMYKNKISSKYIPKTLIHMRTGGVSHSNLSNKIKSNMECRRAWRENGINPKFYTMILKPLSGIPQLFKKVKA